MRFWEGLGDLCLCGAGALCDWEELKRCFAFNGYGFICRLRGINFGGLEAAPRGSEMERCQLQILYSGRVQGVGFRYTVKTLSAGFDLTGTVRNLPDGRVELCAEGARSELVEFQKAIQDSEVGRFIQNETAAWQPVQGRFRGFEIIR